MISITVITIYVVGAVVAYRHLFAKWLHEEIVDYTRRARETGTSVEWYARQIDIHFIRFNSVMASIGWPVFFPIYYLLLTLKSRDENLLKEVTRVAVMLSREMNKRP